MAVILLLIAASMLVALGFLIAFLWSVKSGQYEDNYTPALRMLHDNPLKDQSSKNEKNKTNDK